jgi:uncharacterized protein YciI
VSEYPPIRREVLVDAAPEAAFEIFTAGLGRWWPLADGKGVYCDGAVAFAGGQIIERSASGEQAVWGSVTRWEPPAVVGAYVGYTASPGADDGADTWVALLHRPGPTAREGSLYDDPRFAGHVAFLNRMRDAGYLIAAGPLADEERAGMTVLRLPGADQLGHATILATSDDAAVVQGVLSVTVRPWQVMMSVLTPTL